MLLLVSSSSLTFMQLVYIVISGTAQGMITVLLILTFSIINWKVQPLPKSHLCVS